MAEVRVASWADVEHITQHLREVDRQELIASGLNPDKAVSQAFRTSSHCWAIEGVAIFGVIPVNLLSGKAVVWLLGTDEVGGIGFLRAGIRVTREMLSRYNCLYNWVDARNGTTLAWLSWLGFEVSPPEPFGPYRMPFHRIELRG